MKMTTACAFFTSTVLVSSLALAADAYCTSSICRSRNFYSSKTYCCSDGDCCSYTEYNNQNYYGSYGRTWTVGSIIGTVIGNLIFLTFCIVAWWCFCCRKRERSSGTVIGTSTIVTTHPNAAPPNQPGYIHSGAGAVYYPPPVQQPYPGQPQPQPYPAAQPYTTSQPYPVPAQPPPSYQETQLDSSAFQKTPYPPQSPYAPQ